MLEAERADSGILERKRAAGLHRIDEKPLHAHQHQAQPAVFQRGDHREGVAPAGELDFMREPARRHHAADAAVEQRLRRLGMPVERKRSLRRIG